MNPSNKLKATPNAVDLPMDLLLSRRANTGENQHIANLNHESQPTPQVPAKTLNFALFFCFSAQIYVIYAE